ncbi:Inositol-1-monophosphatase [Richelia intracellularis HM01]|uniref:inositol monophosphatase family protein n=1 Tax=Richelia intracellularis TaxID=1164990 RepID=UPI0002B4E318|nr:inositol monophosphatase family protein [Richelia intracellularis]CCH66153.1 Inositol-1-monophosphatase [Richelia intracellularis HM01]
MSNLKIFLDVATEGALAAGALLQEYLGKVKDTIMEKERPGDLVTVADKESEAVILDCLHRHFPEHAILAEESGSLGNYQNEYLWLIDPLDGTTNYAHQYPCFAISIGLLINGVPRLGVIYDPLHGELFQAAMGLGATLNRQPICVSQTNKLGKSLLATGFAYDRRETLNNNYAEFCHLTHLTQGVRRSGAASIDLAHVACGRVDGYWERGLSPWDIAAGVILVQEAGGKVTAYDEGPLKLYSGKIMATNSIIHQSLSQELLQVPALNTWGQN